MLGNWKPKSSWHCLTIATLLVLNSFMKKRSRTKSNDVRSDLLYYAKCHEIKTKVNTNTFRLATILPECNRTDRNLLAAEEEQMERCETDWLCSSGTSIPDQVGLLLVTQSRTIKSHCSADVQRLGLVASLSSRSPTTTARRNAPARYRTRRIFRMDI